MPKIKLVAPKGATSASFDGTEYPVEKDGSVTVPTEAALVLYGYGFTNAPAEDQPAGEGEATPAATGKRSKKGADSEADPPAGEDA